MISQGKVEIITEKPAGNGFVYNLKLSDGEWYGYGFKKPAFERGASIKFAFTANGKWRNVDVASLEVVEDDRPVVHSATSTPATAAKVDWDGKDKRITFLACRNTAVSIVGLALEHGAIKLGTKNKLEIITGAVDLAAGNLYTSIYGEEYPTTDVSVEAAEATMGEVTDEE